MSRNNDSIITVRGDCYRPQGETVIDSATGEYYSVNPETGEAKILVPMLVESGSQIISPDNQRRSAERKKQAAEYDRRRKLHFFFASANGVYDDIDAANMARLIYLATYLGYDGKLWMSERNKKMTLQDLFIVMRPLKNSAIRTFWDSVKEKYVFEDENGLLSMLKSQFCRGNMAQQTDYQKLYIGAIRDLYKHATPRQHKRLGTVFKMMEFVNLEYNALCHNPWVQDIDELDFMTLDEFLSAIGCDKSNWCRVMREYQRLKLTIAADGVPEYFCAFVNAGGRSGTTRIFVNPNVMYRGHHYEQVYLMEKFTSMKKDASRHSVKTGFQEKTPVKAAV